MLGEKPAPITEVLGLVAELPKAGDEPTGRPGSLVIPPNWKVGAPVSSPAAPALRTVSPNMPSAERIRIPSIGVDAKVVELGIKLERGQWVWETASHAVGHLLGSADPGEMGNVALTGHISSPVKGEGSVFASLPRVKEGDWIFVESQAGAFAYRVKEIRLVGPTDVEVLYPTSSETLTLITCYPDLVYSHRLVVVATPAFLPR